MQTASGKRAILWDTNAWAEIQSYRCEKFALAAGLVQPEKSDRFNFAARSPCYLYFPMLPAPSSRTQRCKNLLTRGSAVRLD